MKIAHKHIGANKPVFVIAEAGVNHNGRFALARKLIDAAAAAGADAVKFQTFRAEDVVVKGGTLARYQRRNMGKRMSQRAMLRGLEFRDSWYSRLIAHAKKRGIIFLSTPHGGFRSVDVLARHKLPALKFGSGELTNTPLLAYAARLRVPLIVSTGMAHLFEVREALSAIRHAGNKEVILLHATTNYPCPPDDTNLRAILTLARLGVPVGYSDHTEGYEASIAAVALGACVIEKHLTLNRALPGPDHRASLEPREFRDMVQALRRVPLMLGNGIKIPQKSERVMARAVRKSIVSEQHIKKGERFTRKNLAIKRPGTGLPPRQWPRIIGKRAARDVPLDTLLKRADIAR